MSLGSEIYDEIKLDIFEFRQSADVADIRFQKLQAALCVKLPKIVKRTGIGQRIDNSDFAIWIFEPKMFRKIRADEAAAAANQKPLNHPYGTSRRVCRRREDLTGIHRADRSCTSEWEC